jgi:hypothetical protein
VLSLPDDSFCLRAGSGRLGAQAPCSSRKSISCCVVAHCSDYLRTPTIIDTRIFQKTDQLPAMTSHVSTECDNTHRRSSRSANDSNRREFACVQMDKHVKSHVNGQGCAVKPNYSRWTSSLISG